MVGANLTHGLAPLSFETGPLEAALVESVPTSSYVAPSVNLKFVVRSRSDIRLRSFLFVAIQKRFCWPVSFCRDSLALLPPIRAGSMAEHLMPNAQNAGETGEVVLLAQGGRYAGGSARCDTYHFHISYDAQDQIISSVATGINDAFNRMSQRPANPETTSALGAIYWRESDGKESMVGCATVEARSDGHRDDSTTYYLNEEGFPDFEGTITETRADDSRYLITHIIPGEVTLVAKIDGREIGRTTVVLKAEKEASTGDDCLFNITRIYADSEGVDPTPKDCGQ
jgi:hypothetical protein